MSCELNQHQDIALVAPFYPSANPGCDIWVLVAPEAVGQSVLHHQRQAFEIRQFPATDGSDVGFCVARRDPACSAYICLLRAY